MLQRCCSALQSVQVAAKLYSKIKGSSFKTYCVVLIGDRFSLQPLQHPASIPDNGVDSWWWGGVNEEKDKKKKQKKNR